MFFHRDFANTETTADLLVQEAHNHQRHHIAFARGEVGVTSLQYLGLLFAAEQSFAPLDRTPDGLQKHIALVRFRQKLDRARFHGLHRHWNITLAGDKNDRHAGTLYNHSLLQVETIEPRKGDI